MRHTTFCLSFFPITPRSQFAPNFRKSKAPSRPTETHLLAESLPEFLDRATASQSHFPAATNGKQMIKNECKNTNKRSKEKRRQQKTDATKHRSNTNATKTENKYRTNENKSLTSEVSSTSLS
jgi:hypothetical protein